MTEKFKPFTTTLLGSMPRSEELVEARSRQFDSPEAHDEYQKILRDETEEVVRFQEKLDLDVIVSGELDRDNYMSYVAQHVPGIKLLTMEELVEITSTKDSFEASLAEGDVDGTDIKNPIVVEKIDVQAELDADQIANVQEMTDRRVKATLPSPYLLTRSCWLDEITADVYEDKQALGDDIIDLLINEIHRLADLGVDIIQLDDPILSEVVFTAASEDTSFY